MDATDQNMLRDGNGCISKEEVLAAVKDHGVDEKEIQEDGCLFDRV